MVEDRTGFTRQRVNLEGKEPVGSPRRRWANNLNSDVHYFGVADDWIRVTANIRYSKARE